MCSCCLMGLLRASIPSETLLKLGIKNQILNLSDKTFIPHSQ